MAATEQEEEVAPWEKPPRDLPKPRTVKLNAAQQEEEGDDES